MKKILKRIVPFVVLALFLSPFAYKAIQAASGDKISFEASPGNSGSLTVGTEVFAIDDVGAIDAAHGNFSVDTNGATTMAGGNLVVNSSGQITTAGGTTRVNYKTINFDLDDFRRVGFTTPPVQFDGKIGQDEAVHYPYITSNGMSSAIVWNRYHPLDWDDGAGRKNRPYYISAKEILNQIPLSPIQVTFQIPLDYRTGGTMRLIGHQWEGARADENTGTRVRLGYRYYITTPNAVTTGQQWDKSAVMQSLYVGTAGHELSPIEINFIMSASETAFSAGQWVTFQYWRIKDKSCVDQFRHLMARFQYYPEY